MRTHQVTTVATAVSGSRFTGASIAIAGGRNAPHHRANEVRPDADPPPVIIAWIGGGGSGGNVLAAHSLDGGKTFSDAGIVARAADGSVFTAVRLFAQDGKVYAFVGVAADGSAEASGGTLDGYVSTDKGVTWLHMDITVAHPEPLTPGGRVFGYRGSYLLPVSECGGSGGASAQSILISEDLSNWRLGGSVPGTESGCVDDGHIDHTQPNEQTQGLIMVMRDADESVEDGPMHEHARYAISPDGGETWSEATALVEVPSHHVSGFFSTDSLGRYVTVFNLDQDRQALKYRVKEPLGPWGPVHDFPSPGQTNERVDGVEVSAGRYYCVFDSDESLIVFADVAF